MNPNEQIIIENFKSQYNSIVGNIKVANEELARILSEKDEETEKLKKIKEDVGKHRAAYVTLVGAHKELNEDSDDLRRDIEDLKKNKETYRETAIRERESMQNLYNEKTTELSKILKEIEQQETRLSALEHASSMLEQAIQSNASNLDGLSANFHKTIIELEEAAARLTKTHQDYDSLIKEKELELAGLQDQIDDAYKGLENPLKSLEEKKKMLARRERDLKLMLDRFQQEFAKAHPGRILRI